MKRSVQATSQKSRPFSASPSRRELDDLRTNTPADGVITGLATINAEQLGEASARAAVIINDYTVLAGTQGYYHHLKLDRGHDQLCTETCASADGQSPTRDAPIRSVTWQHDSLR